MDNRKIMGEPVWVTQCVATEEGFLIKLVTVGVPEAVRAVQSQFVLDKPLFSPATGQLQRARSSYTNQLHYSLAVTKLQGTRFCVGAIVCPELMKDVVSFAVLEDVLPVRMRERDVPFLPEWFALLRPVLAEWQKPLRVLEGDEPLLLIDLPQKQENILSQFMPFVSDLESVALLAMKGEEA